MKRLLAILCIVSFGLFSLGCSADAPKQKESSSDKPILKIGIDIYEPYTYYDDNGQITGADYEIATEACERLGYTPEFIGISWEKKNDLLESGDIDCIWSCYSMTGRLDKYLWAGPYMNSYQAAVVRSDSGITSLEQLAGKRIAVEATTKSEEAWVRHAGDVVPQAASVITYASMDETTSALRLGCADAISGHVGPMSALVEASDGMLSLLPEGFYATQIGVAFDKNYSNTQLVDDLGEILDDMLTDGTIARIVEGYGLDPEQVAGGVKDEQ